MKYKGISENPEKWTEAQCDHFQQFYNRHNVKVHVPIIRWSHCEKDKWTKQSHKPKKSK